MTLSLCLPAASFLTGAVIPVDGGLMAECLIRAGAASVDLRTRASSLCANRADNRPPQ